VDVESSNLAQTPSVAICFPVLPQISGAYGIGNGITALLPSGEVCNGFPLDQLPICIYIRRMIKRFFGRRLGCTGLHYQAHKYHCRNQPKQQVLPNIQIASFETGRFPKNVVYRSWMGLFAHRCVYSTDIRYIQTE